MTDVYPSHRCAKNFVEASSKSGRMGAMLDRLDLEPVFFAPFVSSVMKVSPEWIDYNGHLNMA